MEKHTHTAIPGDMAVVSYFDMAEHIGDFLRNQNSDLLHRAGKLHITQIESWREHLPTALMIGKLLL